MMARFAGIRLGPKAWHTDEGLSAWDLEELLEQAAAASAIAEHEAFVADDEGRLADCEAALDRRDAADRRYRELKQELADLESGW